MKQLIALSLFALAACTPPEETPDAGAEPTPQDDACEHGTEGPFVDVTADSATPPDVSAEHTAYHIATEDLGNGDRGGSVSYAAAEEGDYYLFFSDHVDVKLFDANEAEVALEDSVHEVSECEEIAMYHLVELGVGTARIELQPSAHESLTLVVVPGADEDEGE